MISRDCLGKQQILFLLFPSEVAVVDGGNALHRPQTLGSVLACMAVAVGPQAMAIAPVANVVVLDATDSSHGSGVKTRA